MNDLNVRETRAGKPLDVGIFLFDRVELLDFAGPFEVFSVTSELNDYGLFRTFTVSETGKEIRSVNGLKILPDYGFDNHPPIDILVLPGGIGTRTEMKNRTVLDWISKANASTLITASVCTGALLLGSLGLLDGLEATTHHDVIPLLRETSPAAIVKPDKRFVDAGKIVSSGGISAGIDMSLHIVERLHGEEIRRRTAIHMEYDDRQV